MPLGTRSTSPRGKTHFGESSQSRGTAPSSHVLETREFSSLAPRSEDEPRHAALRRSAQLRLPWHRPTVEESPADGTTLRRQEGRGRDLRIVSLILPLSITPPPR